MLGTKEAIATIGVRDIEVARRFYEGILGLAPVHSDEPGVLLFRSGPSTLLVYQSQYAGTNQATAVTWVVGDEIEAIVKSLRARAVQFEHYEFPGATLNGDVHVTGSMKAAWCKDPDGNILALVSR